MSEGIKGTIPCELFGGPLDGRKYGDLPDTGHPYTNTELSLPLAQPADASPRAIYVCRGNAQVHGLWQFFYERTDYPATVAAIDLPIPHPPFPEAPTATQLKAGGTSAGDAGIQVALARATATLAHKGQTDKAGAPYVTHAARVASRFDPMNQPVEHCAGWLHDVIEDTEIAADDLRAAGVHPDVLTVVLLLTRRPGVSSSDYYRGIITNPAAVTVKAADIDDNTSPSRTRHLDEPTRDRLAAKYDTARRSLGIHHSKEHH